MDCETLSLAYNWQFQLRRARFVIGQFSLGNLGFCLAHLWCVHVLERLDVLGALAAERTGKAARARLDQLLRAQQARHVATLDLQWGNNLDK